MEVKSKSLFFGLLLALVLIAGNVSAEKMRPVADTYLYGYGYNVYGSGYKWIADAGYGTSTYLRVDSNGKRAYLMFDLNNNSTVSQAKLYLKVFDCETCPTKYPITAHYIKDSTKAYFDENTLKWTTQACGTSRGQIYESATCSGVLDTVTPNIQYANYSFDITTAYNDVVVNFPTGQKYLTIVLGATYSDGVDFVSKDYTLTNDSPYIATGVDITTQSAPPIITPTLAPTPTPQPPICTPNWSCSEYAICSSGTQTRTCNDGCNSVRTETKTCITPQPPATSILGDTNGDKKISLSELLNAIRLWNAGRYTDSQIMSIFRTYVGAK